MKKLKVLFGLQVVTAATTGVVLGVVATSYVVTHLATSVAGKLIGGAATYVVVSLMAEKAVNTVTTPIINACISDKDVEEYNNSTTI